MADLLRRVVGWFTAPPTSSETRARIDDPQFWPMLFQSGTSKAGINVTPDSALTDSAVYACVKVLAETISSLPLKIYWRKSSGKTEQPGHPLYYLLHSQPNPELTALELREYLVACCALRGNAYAALDRTPTGDIVAIWPMNPNRMAVVRNTTTGEVVYVYSDEQGRQEAWPSNRIWHLRGLLSHDGITGLSPVAHARESIGLSMAASDYGARFFANDAKPSGILEMPGKLNQDQIDRLKLQWQAAHGGENKSKVAVLEGGLQWKNVGLSNEDAQFLQTRKFQVSDIARIFRVPPHLIGDLERATFSNIEHQAIDFVVHTIRPWLVRIEQSISRDLIKDSEKKRYFAEHLVEGLLRGDIASRYNAYSVGRQWGWLSADDIRGLENMNPLPDKKGEIYLQPMNMVEAGTEPEPKEPATEPSMEPVTEPAGNGNGTEEEE